LKHRLPVVIAATAAIVAVGTAPALATTSGPSDTSATFTLTGGDLTMTAAATAALSSGASGATDISGTLGAVSVTDLRGSAQAWSVSATSTLFVGTGSNPSKSTAVEYKAGTPTSTGTIDFGANLNGTSWHLSTTLASPVIAAGTLSGNNTATWNPTLKVTLPSSALASTYSGTVTTSIL
jgi:hypothetical protein